MNSCLNHPVLAVKASNQIKIVNNSTLMFLIIIWEQEQFSSLPRLYSCCMTTRNTICILRHNTIQQQDRLIAVGAFVGCYMEFPWDHGRVAAVSKHQLICNASSHSSNDGAVSCFTLQKWQAVIVCKHTTYINLQLLNKVNIYLDLVFEISILANSVENFNYVTLSY